MNKLEQEVRIDNDTFEAVQGSQKEKQSVRIADVGKSSFSSNSLYFYLAVVSWSVFMISSYFEDIGVAGAAFFFALVFSIATSCSASSRDRSNNTNITQQSSTTTNNNYGETHHHHYK